MRIAQGTVSLIDVWWTPMGQEGLPNQGLGCQLSLDIGFCSWLCVGEGGVAAVKA